MNYLAHIYLSGHNRQMQIGNFIGDFVKGSQHQHYPDAIQKGILLHRKIDHFTDTHPVVRATVNKLKPEFGRYSAIILDLYFDHFLALHFTQYSNKSLLQFTYNFSLSLLLYYKWLPQRVKNFMFHFIITQRLAKYATIAGLEESFEIMARYKIANLNPQKVITFLNENYKYLNDQFILFFPQLIDFTESETSEDL